MVVEIPDGKSRAGNKHDDGEAKADGGRNARIAAS
jgi:hypothetical protein